MTSAAFGLSMISGMMVDRTISGVDQQVRECMEMRITRARAHMHREQEDENKRENADEREQREKVSSSSSSSAQLEEMNEARHRITRRVAAGCSILPPLGAV